MSDELQSYEETVNAFYPDEEAEPLEVPTAEASTDELPEEAEEAETEEAESTDEAEDDNEDVQSIELDGNEHNLTEVQEWKHAHDNVKLMQADCTKKWQEAADLKKEAEAQAEKAQELAMELEVLISEDKDLDIESYRDIESDNYDPDMYIELKEKAEKREAKLKELKANQPAAQQPLTADELVAESNDFYSYDPAWQKDGELTEAFQKDMGLAANYLKDMGYSQDEVNAISRSHHWKTIIDASKYNAQKNKATSIKKKVVQTPKTNKSKANTTNLSAEDIFYGKN